MSKKYYVVWKGEKTGVFDNWQQVRTYTEGRSDAQFMGFTSKQEAEAAFSSTYTKALAKRALNNAGSANDNNKAKNTRTKATSAKASSAKASSAKTSNSNVTSKADIRIFCDGACSPNPGKSGTGLAIYHQQQNHQQKLVELWYGLYQAMGTNNTAELNGLLVAFRYAKPHINANKSVEIFTDSKYSIDCITKWAKGWQAKGWVRGNNEEIKNLDIIKQCFALYEEIKSGLIITHVKGHANIEGNELSDRMAVYARQQQQKQLVQYPPPFDIKKILAMSSG